MEYKNILSHYLSKKIGFVGVGVSNTAIIKLFLNQNISISVRDKSYIDSPFREELVSCGVKIIEGEDYLDKIDEDMLFLSPAIKLCEKLLQAEISGTVLTGELSEFFKFCKATTICITGSDGKTTSSTMIAKILESDGKTVFLGGNIGKNLFIELLNIKKDDFVVVELSSFQLMKMKPSPDVAVITNISPNHLDWHSDYNEYIDAKKNIFLFQDINKQKLVLNYDNEITRSFANGNHIFFSSKNSDIKYYFDGRYIKRLGKIIVDCDKMPLLGNHNRENLMAAAAALEDYVSEESIRKVATSFTGVEHRCEFVRKLNGVSYYNSSIDSSPTRTKAALESFKTPVVIIAGGYDKNLPLDPLVDIFKEKVHTAILIGDIAYKIQDILQENNFGGKIIHSPSLEDAVLTAFDVSKAGDSVLLSPSAASFDMFKNFAERGKRFKDAVNAL